MRPIRPPVLLACVVLALIAIPAAASALTVTGISPAVAYADSTRTYDIFGTGFASGAGVTLTPAAGGTVIIASGEQWLDFTHLRCTVTIPAGAATGPYTVTVSNPRDTGSGSMANAFTIYARPVVTGMVPASALPASSFAASLDGTGFVPGTEVFIRGGPIGTSLVFATGETVVSPTRIGCSFNIPFDAYPGLYDVYVRSHDSLDDLLAGNDLFTVTLPAATSITALTPASALPGATLSVDVTGSGFTSGAEVIVQGGPSGGPTIIPATGETLVAPGTVRCTLAIPADAYIGPYTAYLRNPGGEWVYRSNAFTVVAPVPTVSGISPASADPGQTLSTVYVTGTGFVAGAEVRLEADDTGYSLVIDATDEVRVNATTVRCALAIPASAPPGPYLVFARNPGTVWSAPGPFSFAVHTPVPSITGISPGMALPGQVMQGVDVTGSGFAGGAQVRIRGGTGGTTEIGATGETWVNATAIRCSITVPFEAWPGPYAVEVMNLYGDWVSRPGAFTVVAPVPTIMGISPATALPGETVHAHVTGTGFVRGTMVAIIGPGATVVGATNETWWNSTSLFCDLAIPASAGIGPYRLAARNPGGDWVYQPDAFTVVAPVPTVAGISPALAYPGETLATVYVTGTGFANGAEGAISDAGGVPFIYATGETWVNATTIRCTLAIPAGTYPRPYDVSVRNPGGSWVSRYNAFSVQSPRPTVNGISPNSAFPGQTVSTVYVFGTGFANGAAVEIGTTWLGHFTTLVSATGATWVNATTIRCTLAIPENATPRTYDVLVGNPEYHGSLITGVMHDAFTVTPPIPRVAEISPNSALVGTTLGTVTVTGSGFANGAEVAINGGTSSTWIYATDEAWISPTQLRCSLPVPADAYPGSYGIYVRNPGIAEWYGRPSGFSVLAPTPTIAAISPNRAVPGEKLDDVRVTGTGFVNGAQIQVYGGQNWDTSFSATGVSFVNETTIVCSLAVPADASPGLYDVYIRNPPGFEIAAGFTDGFTIFPAAPPVVAVPPSAILPTDTNVDGLYDDVNGNGRRDFADVVLYFNQMSWIAANEPVALFDYNGNARIDFADVVWLFNHL